MAAGVPHRAGPPAPAPRAGQRGGHGLTQAARPAAAPRPFYSVAHRAGNNLHHLEEALAAGVDAIECDFWHANGRLVVRHERKLPALPVLYDRWYVRFALGALKLPVLLRAIDRRADLFLDIKSASPRAADAVLALRRDQASLMPRTAVSSPSWKVLDRIAAAGTDLRIFYSVGKRAGIDALLARARSAPPPAGTSIRHTLLTQDVVDRLHEAGLQVYAWTVNNPHRAAELLAWGVDGLIFDDVTLPGRLPAP